MAEITMVKEISTQPHEELTPCPRRHHTTHETNEGGGSASATSSSNSNSDDDNIDSPLSVSELIVVWQNHHEEQVQRRSKACGEMMVTVTTEEMSPVGGGGGASPMETSGGVQLHIDARDVHNGHMNIGEGMAYAANDDAAYAADNGGVEEGEGEEDKEQRLPLNELERHNIGEELSVSTNDGDDHGKNEPATPLHTNIKLLNHFAEEDDEKGGDYDVSRLIENHEDEYSQSSEQQQHQSGTQQPIEKEHHTKGRKRRTNTAIIEDDASTAFSPCRPVPLLVKGVDEAISRRGGGGGGVARSSIKRRGKRQKAKKEGTVVDVSTDGVDDGGEHDTADDKKSPQHSFYANQTTPSRNTPIAITVQSLFENSRPDDSDSLLQSYLPQVNALDEYYTKVPSYRIGKRNLPRNQIEVVLRRRAVKKREVASAVAVESNASGNQSVSDKSNNTSGNESTVATMKNNPDRRGKRAKQSSRDSQASSNSPRRTLFLPSQKHFRNQSHGKDATVYEDDSTISSATVASTWTTSLGPFKPVTQPVDPQLQTSQEDSTALISSQMPKEEIEGDTSLGLKLTILQGKVIVQTITPLDDGRASPAQLCGLLTPGDILIAVNGKSLINGTIHNPVSMERMFSVLKPLSQPLDAEDGQYYAREVRLRLVLDEGRELLRDQKEREERKQREREERKRLGLDSKGGNMVDPAADLFGLSSFMAVDQHSGMPMFGHWEDRHHKVAEKEGGSDAIALDLSILDGGKQVKTSEVMQGDARRMQPLFTRALPSLQAQIAQQVALERQWIRSQNTSEFFSLDDEASLLLRAPSPVYHLEVSQFPLVNPIDARKMRLQRGAENMLYAKDIVSKVELQEKGLDNIHHDEDPLEIASRVCGTASIRTGASRRRWHRGDSADDACSTAASASFIDNQLDTSTAHSGDSVEECDHRLLVELAANNESWKRNVIVRLKAYAKATEKEGNSELVGKSSIQLSEEDVAPTSLDSLLFGGDVAKILEKKKQSLALPPGEMTSMLFDLVEHLESGLPMQIFTKDDSSTNPLNASEKVVSFMKTPIEMSVDITKATDFLLNNAFDVWLKSFRPLPWKQRRALWPLNQSGGNADSGSTMASSHFDDGLSISIASAGTSTNVPAEKRNLREVIEEMELDPETRIET